MKTIYDFFTEHDCNQFEQARLIEHLAQMRYLKTLEMLKRILR